MMDFIFYAALVLAGTFVGALGVALAVMGKDDEREEPPHVMPRMWHGENK